MVLQPGARQARVARSIECQMNGPFAPGLRQFARPGSPVYGRHMHWATPEERRALGQARRKQVGRQAHEEFDGKARPVPPWMLLQRAERGRLPALLKLKHQSDGRRRRSPIFAERRPVMAADLGAGAQHRHWVAALRRRACAQPRAHSPRPMAGWSSTSTISTRRFVGPSSGT